MNGYSLPPVKRQDGAAPRDILGPVTRGSLVPRGLHFGQPERRFEFRNRYDGLYSNKHERFVLREEHVAELKRIVREHNQDRHSGSPALSISDVVNAVLDFAFEHPAAFYSAVGPDRLRESFGNEVYRRAYLTFLRERTDR